MSAEATIQEYIESKLDDVVKRIAKELDLGLDQIGDLIADIKKQDPQSPEDVLKLLKKYAGSDAKKVIKKDLEQLATLSEARKKREPYVYVDPFADADARIKDVMIRLAKQFHGEYVPIQKIMYSRTGWIEVDDRAVAEKLVKVLSRMDGIRANIQTGELTKYDRIHVNVDVDLRKA